MVKTPILKLYYPNGTEVLLEGVNICFKGLIAFSYKYSEKSGDKGHMTFRFNKPFPFSLRVFEPGSFYQIKWGYLQNLSPFRLVAISAVTPTYNRSGWTLKVDITSKVDYVDANGSGWTTVEEAILALGDLAIEYEWFDKQNARKFLRYSRRSNGEPFVNLVSIQPWAKEPLEKEYVDIPSPLFEASAGLAGEASLTESRAKYSKLEQLFLDMFGVSRDSLTDSLKAILTAFLIQNLKGHFLDTRDDKLIIKKAELDATPLFGFDVRPGFSAPFILSCTVSKGSATNAGVSAVATTVDPLDKSVDTTDFAGADLPDSIPGLIKDLDGKTIETTFTLLKKNKEFFYRPIDSDTLIPADPSTVQKWNTAYIAWQEANQLAEVESFFVWPYPKDFIKPLPQDYSPEDPRQGPRSLFPVNTLKNLSGNKYQIEVKDARKVNSLNLVPLTLQRTYPYTREQALNLVQDGVMNMFFNNLQGKITIEGLPVVEVGFNFNLQGLGDLVDGKFHCSESTHSIVGGKYTTTIKGGKIPIALKTRTQKITQVVNRAFDTLEEESIQPVADVLNAHFGMPGIMRLLAGRPEDYKFFKIVGIPTVESFKDAIPDGTSATPGAFDHHLNKNFVNSPEL